MAVNKHGSTWSIVLALFLPSHIDCQEKIINQTIIDMKTEFMLFIYYTNLCYEGYNVLKCKEFP